jgi:hypothetical protein
VKKLGKKCETQLTVLKKQRSKAKDVYLVGKESKDKSYMIETEELTQIRASVNEKHGML